MNISKHKNTILIMIIVLLAFFGYWFFFLSKKDPSTDGTTTSALKTESPTVSNTQYDKEFVTSLLGLNSVNLDVTLFQSKVYQALSYPDIPFVVNYTRESGRENPFLPIGVDSSKPQNVQTQINEISAPNTSAVSSTTTPATVTPTPTPTPKRF